jgi:predicted DNA-binding transcriptional regulator AlpA
MQEYKVSGPDGPTVGMEAVRALLGGVSEDTVNRLIAQGRFPRPFRAGAKSPAQWQSAAVACWLAIAPMMYPDEAGGDDEAPAGGRK